MLQLLALLCSQAGPAVRDLFILGSGRSGTSMVAGSLRSAGYRMGSRLYAGRPANPFGFFESPVINRLNGRMVQRAGGRAEGSRLSVWSNWLATLPVDVRCSASWRDRWQIARFTDLRPFAFKDPRFVWTLPNWAPYAPEAGVVCVFRNPARTIESIRRECLEATYLRDVEMTHERATALWLATYTRVRWLVEQHAVSLPWLFVDADEFHMESRMRRLGEFSGATVDAGFVQPRLQRTEAEQDVPEELGQLYSWLQGQAQA